MKKEQLIGLVQHVSGSTPEEAKELLSLKEKYPYSQVLHVLSARAGKDHNWQNHQSLLQTAAVYSTDRSVLKDVMTKQLITSFTESRKTKITTPAKSQNSDSDVAEQTIHDLERLVELKHNFEVLVEEIENNQHKEESIKETKPKRSPGRPRKKKTESSDPIIEEIKSTKKKIAPESEKTKEQIQLIDQFIKTQPNITPKAKAETNPPGDLSLKSGEFGDNIVSETLVDILLKQGKKEKAIEVLRKLIWKFPQKKAYFAAQIEELKK